jgi:hypothetical protein
VTVDCNKSESSQTLKGVRQRSILSPVQFNMVTDDTIMRITKGKESGLPKSEVYTDNI